MCTHTHIVLLACLHRVDISDLSRASHRALPPKGPTAFRKQHHQLGIKYSNKICGVVIEVSACSGASPSSWLTDWHHGIIDGCSALPPLWSSIHVLLSVVDCDSQAVSQNQCPLKRLPRVSCYFSEESKRFGVCTTVIPHPFPLLSCVVSSCISYCLCCYGWIPGVKQFKVGKVAWAGVSGLTACHGREGMVAGGCLLTAGQIKMKRKGNAGFLLPPSMLSGTSACWMVSPASTVGLSLNPVGSPSHETPP